MRKWLLGFPSGVGLATLRAILKLCAGFSAEKSGVFSAGNGPAVRSAIIGVCYGNKRDKMKNIVRLSTRITHTDPKAEYGALAVALAAYGQVCVRKISLQLLEGSSGYSQDAPMFPFFMSFLRNLFFMVIVFIHGFRRFLPPY